MSFEFSCRIAFPTPPSLPTDTQNEAVTQERSLCPSPPSFESDSTHTPGSGQEIADGLDANDPPLGAVHVDPLKVVLRSFSSIAEQKVEVGQDTPTRERSSIEIGELQTEPLNKVTRPLWSTAAQNFDVEHDTATRKLLLGVSTWDGTDQLVPLNSSACPERSTAAQNDLLGQEIALRSWWRSMLAGRLQRWPLKIVTSPASLTAAQNRALGHDTDANPPISTLTGPVHRVPWKVAAADPPTVAQKVMTGHDTECMSMSVNGACRTHDVPSKPHAPSWSPVASQNDDVEHDTDSNPWLVTGTGALHVPSYSRALPSASMAIQNCGVGHDTVRTEPVSLTDTGADQLVPLKISA